MNYFTKISGWLLFFTGFLIIISTLWYSYNIFSAKAGIPDFFQTPKAVKNASTTIEGQELDALLQKSIESQLKGLLPVDLITKSLDLTAWAIIALILMSGGSRISDLGIKLIKIGQEKNNHV
jgi:hypothetical protein